MVQMVSPSELIGSIAMERGFAVIGLGYVGLPVALALAKKFEPVIGFDISKQRIAALRNGVDATGEVTEAALLESGLCLTDSADAVNEASFIVVTVPTPIDSERRPDLSPLAGACELIGKRLGPGSVVVFEFDGLPRSDAAVLRAALGPVFRVAARDRFQTRLFTRTDQSWRQATPLRNNRQDRGR